MSLKDKSVSPRTLDERNRQAEETVAHPPDARVTTFSILISISCIEEQGISRGVWKFREGCWAAYNEQVGLP